MTVLPIKRLYLVAGFAGIDHERTVTEVQRLYKGGDRRFLSRVYPTQPDKQAGYLLALVREAVTFIFGRDGATNFCRRQDKPCAVDPDNNKHRIKTCEIDTDEPIACAKKRPHMIIVICADRLFDEVFARLGRAVLIHRLEDPVLPDATALKALIDGLEPTVARIYAAVDQRAKALYAPLAPYWNFQVPGGHPIAAEVQADPTAFDRIMAKYHTALYDGGFRNPVKKKMRGAYMLDANVAFQQDHLHKSVQIIGADSRRDGFHLLNAYHVYGVKTDPGFHFDVMNRNDGAIGRTFDDVLEGNGSQRTEPHLNITPCDRLV